MTLVGEFESILKEECNIYQSIIDVEGRKSEAILERKGEEIKELTSQVESLVARLDHFERRREMLMAEYIRESRLDVIADSVSLKDIMNLADEDSCLRLSILGDELKNLIMKAKSLSETNESLLRDNIELFRLLLDGIRGRAVVTSGYTNNGSFKEVRAGSLLFNQTM